MTRRNHSRPPTSGIDEVYAFENGRRKAVRLSRHVDRAAEKVRSLPAYPAVTGTAADFQPVEEFSIECPSGSYLNFVDPDPAAITLEDIAHSLSQINRFGGHTSRPYCVAEHTVRVARKLRDQGYDAHTQMAGLHHDDAEYCLGDIPTPLKKLFGYSYRSLTKSIDQAIWKSISRGSYLDAAVSGREHPLNLWSVGDFAHEAVKLADSWALCCEAHELMPSKGAGWADTHEWGAVDEDAPSYGWNAIKAEGLWLGTHHFLKQEILGG